MDTFYIKLRYIYFPFLLIAFIFIPAYTFLHWFLIIKKEWFTLNQTILEFGLPIVLLAVCILLWIRPRVKLLRLKGGNGNLPFFFYFVACIALAVPTIVAQKYMVTATGKLTPLTTIEQITEVGKTKYYTLENYQIDKHNIGVYRTANTSGKYNQTLNLYFYITCPILTKDALPPDTANVIASSEDLHIEEPLYIVNNRLVSSNGSSENALAALNLDPKEILSIEVLKDSAATTIYGEQGKHGVVIVKTKPAKAIAWLGIKYHKSISNRLSPEEIEQEQQNFANKVQAEFESTNLNQFEYLDRIGESDDLAFFKNGLAVSDRFSDSMPNVILVAEQEPFTARNGDKLFWIFGSFGIGAVVWILMLLFPKLNEANMGRFLKGEPSKDESLAELKSVILPKRHYTITPILLNLNIALYLILMLAGEGFISFTAEGLLNWGGNYRPATINGQWWRLFTSMFLHSGIMHLLMNMFSLFIIGSLLEPYLGRIRFLLLYLGTGLCGSFISILWNTNIISVGASGAIFGLYGILLALLLTRALPVELSKTLKITAFVFVGFNLVFGFIIPGIDNAAHVGGLLSGFLIGYVLGLTMEQQQLEDELENQEQKRKVIN